jgi:lipopolysaccharide export system protein LptC
MAEPTRENAPQGQGAGRGEAAGRGASRRLRPPRLSGRSAYSIFVNALKVLLPAVALGLVLLIVIWPQLDDGAGFRLDLVERLISAPVPEEATMINPRYEGVDEKRRPFMITADLARQLDPGRDETIEMEQPAADLFDDAGDWVAITADHGIYRQAADILLLDGNVNIFHDGGYELMTEQAVVDLAADLATSSTPTRGQGSFGTIVSEGLRVEERGARVYFTGKAHMVLYPEQDTGESAGQVGQ